MLNELVTANVTRPKKKLKIVPARSAINQRYQFDSFVVGPNNALAFAAAQAVAEQPGGLYNPLYIYGGRPWQNSFIPGSWQSYS